MDENGNCNMFASFSMQVSWHCTDPQQDAVRQLQGQVQEGAGRHPVRDPGHRPQRDEPRHRQEPDQLIAAHHQATRPTNNASHLHYYFAISDPWGIDLDYIPFFLPVPYIFKRFHFVHHPDYSMFTSCNRSIRSSCKEHIYAHAIHWA